MSTMRLRAHHLVVNTVHAPRLCVTDAHYFWYTPGGALSGFAPRVGITFVVHTTKHTLVLPTTPV